MKFFKIFLICTLPIVSILAQSKRAMTVEDLWAMKRIDATSLSPDGKTIVFSVKSYSIEKNNGQSNIYLIDSDGKNLRLLKNSAQSESAPQFTPDGKISYIVEGQLHICDLNGHHDSQITDFYDGVSDVRWSKDGSKILFVSSVYPECETQECNKKRDEAAAENKVNVKVYEDLMFRHWDEWRSPKRSHLFMFDLKSKKYTDLTLNSQYDVPPIALGSSNDFNFSPDGKEVALTMNQSKVLATSTNNDIYLVDLTQLKENMVPQLKKISVSDGNDNQPVYSPDGKYIAFVSMARAGFEADKQALQLYERSTGKLIDLSGRYDISVGEFIWSPDSKEIYYTAANHINESIYKINIHTSENEIVLEQRSNSSLMISADGKTLYFNQQRSTQPNEIFSLALGSKQSEQLTFINKKLLDEIEFNEIETFWSEGGDDAAKVQSILVKPPFFEEGKKYPMIFIIHGGPQGHTSDNFHYRWNLQLFASKGYVVVAPNPRGSTGYGQKFTDEISKDWGGKVYIELINVYDNALKQFSFIDEKNTFAAGASYGGYMVNWIAGHTDRFNALVSHDGVFNLKSMYGTTEELWFPEWEFGGTPWESKELYEKWSPSNYVEYFKTPMLVVQGGKDYRVPEGQGFELYTSLQKMGIASKFVYFPEENHFVLKPQNSRFWWNTVFEWFSKFHKR